MGQLILQEVVKEKEAKLVGGTERPGHPLIGQEIEEIVVTDDLAKSIQPAEVVIDFTTPTATLNHLEIVLASQKKMVIGTTGFSEVEKEKIREASFKIPIVFSPNMSLGMNLLFKIVGEVARVLDYDLEIIEAHHHFKKDAPSGTALKIAEILAEARGKKLKEVAVYGRKGLVGPRREEEIGISVIRAGDILGEHTVLFGGEGERLEITHRVQNRATFAYGAVKAALFLAHQEKGLYNMQDVLFR
jgi:4-hydroxy-tetrahydrodipicolinate reductase